MRLIPDNWPPPTCKALAVFSLAIIAIVAAVKGYSLQVALPISTGLIGFLNSGKESQ